MVTRKRMDGLEVSRATDSAGSRVSRPTQRSQAAVCAGSLRLHASSRAVQQSNQQRRGMRDRDAGMRKWTERTHRLLAVRQLDLQDIIAALEVAVLIQERLSDPSRQLEVPLLLRWRCCRSLMLLREERKANKRGDVSVRWK